MYKTTRKLSKLKECPYCKSELTETEREFFPCTCTFQACVDCYKDIMRNKGVCPSCHTHLKLERLNALHASKREELSKKDIDKVQAKKGEKKSTTTITVVTTVSTKGGSHSTHATSISHYHEEISRAGLSKLGFTELSKLRVIQKNMVYVIGLAPQIATTDTLEKFEYFGQYGKITKTIVNKSNVYNAHGPGGPSYSAYVTFSNDVEASTAILAVDEVTVYDRIIRASYGTTKYCTFFLRDKVCPNPGCLYLHSFGKEKDSFVKDENVSNRDIFNDQQRLALEHIQKHYQEILKKLDSNSKLKTILPSVKIVQTKVQDFIAENEKQKAALKAKEPALKTPEKPIEAPKTQKSVEISKEWAEGTPIRKVSAKDKDKDHTSAVKNNEEVKQDESKENKETSKDDQKIDSEKEKDETTEEKEKEDKIAKQVPEIGSPSDNNKEDLTAKSDAKGEPSCRSHRSFSTKSTTANSVKKDSLTDQKEEMDSRMSVKSTESATKEADAITKQEEATVQSQATEDIKENNSLFVLIDKVQVKEINGDAYQDEFDRKIIENLLSNLSSQSSSRFRIVQEDDKEDSDETKMNEAGSDGWDIKNEEFNLISKSIQEYIQSPTLSSENSRSDHEENVFFTATKHMIENFSTPTKKVNSISKKSLSDEKVLNGLDSKSATYKPVNDEIDHNKLIEKGQSVKVQPTSINGEEDKLLKDKMHKKNNKSSSKTVSSVNINNVDKNGLPIKDDNKIIGSHIKNMNINATQNFNMPNNGTHNLIHTTL